jgi:beta-glucosidase
MSAYNKVSGEYCGHSKHLLTDILRGEWGFTGFVHSDWIKGVYEVRGAAAGLDVENPEPLVFGDKLAAAVERGEIAEAVIDQAGTRILTTLYRFAAAPDPLPDYPESLVACAAHRALALEAAEKSAVLLANDGTLPFDPAKVGKLAVLGRLAGIENTGDNGSSRVRPPEVVTALDGLKARLGAVNVLHATEADLAAAQAVAAAADAVVVVVGLTAKEEGEFIPGGLTLGEDGSSTERGSIGGDRRDLRLSPDQVALIDAAARSGKPVAVVIVAGSAVLVEEWHDQAGAILQTFYSGMAGGTALARLLFGEVSPSGKLPFTVARGSKDYPPFDPDAEVADYGYWHGYALFDRSGAQLRYPFGHGLSYGAFEFSDLQAAISGDDIAVQVTVRNSGAVAADEIVQVYVGTPGLAAERPAKSLKAFARIALQPGESKTVKLSIALANLRWRDPEAHDWKLERGAYRILAGGSSDKLIAVQIEV